MSTTFAVKLKDGSLKDIARRVGRGVLGVELRFTDEMAELLPDETKVVPTDNSAQGIFTIGDIRSHIRKQEQAEEPEEDEEDQSWIQDPSKIKFNQRKSVFVPMEDAWHKEHDFMEVTQWTNGEGWDITISDDKQISLHFTEFAVLKELIQKLEDND
jgi:hypothetical protein